jgi:hypothetical protein
MKTLLVLLGLLVAAPAVASEPVDCYSKTVLICPSHRPKVHKKPKIVIKPGPLIIYRDVEKRVEVPVKVPVYVPLYQALSCPGCGPDRKVVVGAWAALGVGVRDPYLTGNVGLYLRLPRIYLGARVYSVLQYGVAVQILPYVYQGARVRVHIVDPGVLITGRPFALLGERDLQRRVDFLFGAGAEVKLTCHLDLTLDLRTALPTELSRSCNGCGGTRIDAGHVVGNAFASTQLLAGLLFHF